MSQGKLQKQADGIARKLVNEGFFSKVPEQVVEGDKAKLSELEGQLKVMNEKMQQLKVL